MVHYSIHFFNFTPRLGLGMLEALRRGAGRGVRHAEEGLRSPAQRATEREAPVRPLHRDVDAPRGGRGGGRRPRVRRPRVRAPDRRQQELQGREVPKHLYLV